MDLWIRRLERISAWGACILLIINVGDIILGVFCRYVLKNSLIWTEEAARFSLVWMVMVGALGAAVRGDHMAIDFVVPHLPAALRRLVEWGRFLLALLILSLMIYVGTINAMQMRGMRTIALNIPKTIPLLSVPVGFLLLLAGTILAWFNRGEE
ncbi:MAG: TRAP transporter small permease [Synergistota bacterium]|nr:TRAP transporter small permease [Synergistota bacterium]